MIQVACSMMLNDTGLLRYGQMSRVSNPELKLIAKGTLIQHWTDLAGCVVVTSNRN